MDPMPLRPSNQRPWGCLSAAVPGPRQAALDAQESGFDDPRGHALASEAESAGDTPAPALYCPRHRQPWRS